MAIEGELIDELVLDNGQILKMFDFSRHVSGDRWFVSFKAVMQVEIKPEYLKNYQDSSIVFEDVKSKLNEYVTYDYESNRNFIPESDTGELLKSMKEGFLKSNLGYLSSSKFPFRLIMRKYQQAISPEATWKKC